MKPLKYFLFILLPVLMLLSLNCSDDKHEQAEGKKTLYTCPMHPQIISDKPGVCPICHMELVVKTDDSSSDQEAIKGLTIGEGRQVLANISTIKVQAENIYKSINAYSYLDFAEQNRKVISARFNGRIEKLYVDKTGDYITKGEPLFEIYSPEIVQAQNDYLLALNGGLPGTGQNTGSLINSARQRLLLFGLADKQISDLEKNKSVSYTIKYYSPFSGTVIDKKVQEGMYVNEGSIIYDIADMSTLWNIAEVYESDLNTIKQGAPVQLRLNSYPGEVFSGKVILVYPVVNSDSRTIKVRSAIANKGNKLKPNMYGETSFAANLGTGLTVPEEAVLLTGKRNIVWVQVSGSGSQKSFEPREVVLGARFNGKYQVLSGVSEGEYVASSGAYLIDSESQLQGGLSGSHQHGTQEPAGSEKNKENENHNMSM